MKRCNDKVDAIVKKVSDLEESFEAFGKGSDSVSLVLNVLTGL